MIGQDDFIKSQLLAYLWRFRKLESLNGMAAIGCTLRNQVLSGWFNGDWLSVLKSAIEKAAFTEIEFPDFRDPLFSRLVWKVESIFDGSIEDLSAGAKFWCHLPTVSEEFKKAILQQPQEHPRLANVGGLYFFA